MGNKYAAAELIDQLRSWAVACPGALPSGLVNDIIAVLEQAERWENVIEAAGKVDKATCLSFFNRVMEDIGACLNTSDQIRALLSALPEPESQRREGHSHLVYDKARRAIVVKETGEPALPDPPEGGKAG